MQTRLELLNLYTVYTHAPPSDGKLLQEDQAEEPSPSASTKVRARAASAIPAASYALGLRV